jgi:hypothetical protein
VNNGSDNFTNTVFADSGAAQIPISGAQYSGLFKPWTTLFTVTSYRFNHHLDYFGGFGMDQSFRMVAEIEGV